MARVLVQIPDPRRHLVRYYGSYATAARGKRRKAEAQLGAQASNGTSEEALPTPPERAALRRRWANLIRRVYEVHTFVCPRLQHRLTEPSMSLGRPENLFQAIRAGPLDVLRREPSVLRNPSGLASRVRYVRERPLNDCLDPPGRLRRHGGANRIDPQPSQLIQGRAE